MKRFDKRGDTPTMDTDDALKVKIVAGMFRFRGYTNETKITELITDAVNRMSGAGESAESNYQLCIDSLCRKGKLVSSIIQDEYFDMPEDAYLDRWALVMLAVELQSSHSLKFFAKVASSEIPEEKCSDPHSFTTVGEEVMICTTAIEGLERMAVEGNEEAVKILFKNIAHKSFSVRRAATQALLAIGNDDINQKLQDKLPKHYHDLLKISRTDVRKAEQAEGGLFLKSRDQDETPIPQEDKEGKTSSD